MLTASYDLLLETLAEVSNIINNKVHDTIFIIRNYNVNLLSTRMNGDVINRFLSVHNQRGTI